MIGLLLARRYPTVTVTGVELDAERAHWAAENARANALAERCRIVRADLRAAPRIFPPEHFDRVVANPPYRKPGSGATPPDPGRAGARLELTFTLADLARTAAALLRYGGSVCTIHLAERLPELWSVLEKNSLTPKVLRLVAPRADSAPRLCLVAATKGGRPGLCVLPNLVLHDPGQRYTDEVAALVGDAPGPRRARDKKHLPDK